jgi:hypothetical protein
VDARLGKVARDAIAYHGNLRRTQREASGLQARWDRIALIDYVHHLVGAWIDDADLLADDEIAVVAIVGKDGDDLARHRV